MSGLPTTTCLSNLPGLKRAGSKTSGLFVAAIKIIPHWYQNRPSLQVIDLMFVLFIISSTKSSTSTSTTASISSIKIIHGECFFPCSNISLTLKAQLRQTFPKSEPEIEKKGTFLFACNSLLIMFYLFQEAQLKGHPLGIFPPRRLNFLGSFKNSTISSTSSFASSTTSNIIKSYFTLSFI